MRNIRVNLNQCRSQNDSTHTTGIKAHGPEIRSGRLQVSASVGGRTRTVGVIMKVYNTSFERYAVLYPDKVHCQPCGYYNLNNCSVESVTNTRTSFRILDRGAEGRAVTFVAQDANDLALWLTALGHGTENLSVKEGDLYGPRSPVIPRSPLMPTLQEAEEEG